ncbi:hypothetical protein KHC23_13045 [Ancylobacter dichloromethanicus]|uniref:Uncharacterized protein n=1 Tax=Ancylobacter dichloromethanicus TaxID=518825 RepID=A0A9W6MZ71_9HYPH|nr:phage tail tube protein [Ancylobacter dichloromethanicus]MBS7554580.1 hypothetical protein [Ancylobacter dichloromethanicus]GLK71710.1 hypothetical protein GCM10017643_18250 [Ancylobacter dichloromethanicus]
MGRAAGINALMSLAFEATYGTAPASGYRRVPFISTTLGAERGLLPDDLLGYGRDPLAPSRDVVNAGGDVVVPVDLRNFGLWLKLLLGAPTTTTASTVSTHVFTSAKLALPSASVEISHPEVPSHAMNKGVMANSLAIRMQRSGQAQATIGLIGQSEVVAGTSGAGTPTALDVSRFSQFHGAVKRLGSALGNVVSADLTFSNNYESIEVLRNDGLIAGGDPGKATFNASLTVRFDSLDLYNLALAGTPSDLEFSYTIDASNKLTLALPAVHLPVPKRPVTGPTGVQATFTVQGARPTPGTAMLTATLVNDVASY